MMQNDRTLPSREELREWLANCNPQQPLEPGDERYYDLGAPLAEPTTTSPVSLRGDDQVERLYDAIDLLGDASCQLFSGFSGTGKSTELRRLAHRLEQDGYTVLLVDAQGYHDLHRGLAIEDLMVILAGAFGDATSARLGKDVVAESYWKQLVDFLRQEIHVQDAKLPMGIADLKIGIGHAKPFWIEVRKALALSLGKLRDHSHAFIRGCVAKLQKQQFPSRGVVFIVDNLERLRAPIGQFQEVMESVMRLLSDYADYLRLPDCHVIYTVPPYVQLVSPGLNDRYDGASFVLPAIKVSEPGLPLRGYAPGIAALSELVARRVPIERVFGDRRDLLEQLILDSGGHVRTLISFLQQLLLQAKRSGLPPSAEEIERLVRPFRERARVRMGRQGRRLLAKILQHGHLDDIEIGEHATLASLMDEYLVLCYLNGENRYEVHPLIRSLVEQAMRQDEAAED